MRVPTKKDDELELVDPAPPGLTLTYQFPNGTVVHVELDPPTPDFFKTVEPGDVLKLKVRSAREFTTRTKDRGTPVKRPAKRAPAKKTTAQRR